MKTFPSLLVSGAFLGAFPNLAISSEDVENIVIVGARTPIDKQLLTGAVSIIDRVQIEASKALNLTDLLRGQAGFSVSQSGGPGALTELRVRGSESNHILVLLDGIEINDGGQDGIANLAHINLDNIERIEILKGAQSALWGSGAVSGVINLVSRAGLDAQSGKVSLEAGQSDSRKLALSTLGKIAGLSYAASASHLTTDGQNIALTGDEKDGYHATQLSGNLNWQVNQASEVKVTLRFVDGQNEFDDFVPSDADKHTDIQQLQSQLVWTHATRQNVWQQQLGAQFNQNHNDNFSDNLFDSRVDSDKLRLFWQHNIQYSDNGALSLVAEHSAESYLQESSFSNQEQDIEVNSLVLDLLHEFSDQINITISYRYDNNSEFDSASSYRAGLNYRPGSNLKFFASYGEAVKNPTFTEVFGFIPESFIGNPDLKPETAKSLELGGQYQFNDGWQLALSYYNTKLQDEITTLFFPDFTSTAENATGDSEREGVDVELNGYLGPVKLSLSYGYNDASQPNFAGTLLREARRARNTASLSMLYPFNQDNSSLYVQTSYQGNQLDTDFSTFSQVTLGGYTVVDVTLRHQLSKDWTLFARANNLFDKSYQDVFGFRGQEQRVSAGVEYLF